MILQHYTEEKRIIFQINNRINVVKVPKVWVIWEIGILQKKVEEMQKYRKKRKKVQKKLRKCKKIEKSVKKSWEKNVRNSLSLIKNKLWFHVENPKPVKTSCQNVLSNLIVVRLWNSKEKLYRVYQRFRQA